MSRTAEPGVLVRGGPPRIIRSALSGTWYVVTSYRDLGGGTFIASAKREIHPDDARDLEALYQRVGATTVEEGAEPQ